MKTCVLLVVVVALSAVGCSKKTLVPEVAPAGVPVVAPQPRASAVPPPPRSQELGLVAVGKNASSKIIWLRAIGARVWLSGTNFDAYADGDGPLVPAPDLLKGLPYVPKRHVLRVFGDYPRIFVLRTEPAEARGVSEDPRIFLYGNPGWKEAKPLPRSDTPDAFVAWGDGALLFWSQMSYPSGAYRGPEPGTQAIHVAPDGSVADAKLPIDRTFMVWNADSDGTHLALVGVKGIQDKAARTPVVVRGTREAMTATELFTGPELDVINVRARVHENGVAAVVSPASGLALGGKPAWKTGPGTVHVVASGQARTQLMSSAAGCRIEDAAPFGEAIVAYRTCDDPEENAYLRTNADPIPLPSLVKKDGGGLRIAKTDDKGAITCRADRGFVVHGKDDLWLIGSCGGIPAIFRTGATEEPVILP